MSEKATVVSTMKEFVDDYHKIRMGKHDREVALRTMESLANRLLDDGVITREQFMAIIYQQ